MKKLLCSVFLGLSLICPVNAQNELPAAEFEVAQQKATVGDYEGAITILKGLTEVYPENYEYQLYLARVYSWDKAYAEAIAVLQLLMKDGEYNPELMQLMVNVQLWAGNHEEVIRYSDLAWGSPLPSISLSPASSAGSCSV